MAALVAVAAVGGRARALPGGAPMLVRDGHPRLFITPLTRGDLQMRSETSHKAVFDRISEHANGLLDAPIAPDWRGLAYLPTFALMYQVTGEEKYAKKAAGLLDSLSGGWPRDETLAAYYLRAASVAYDWCHDAFEGDRLRRYALAMKRAAEALERVPEESDFNSDLAVRHLSLLWVGTALAGDGLVDQDARRWVEKGSALLRDRVLAAGNVMAHASGGHAEGFTCAGWGFTPSVAQTVELWRVASGENLFLEAPCLRYNALWNVYCRRPFDGALARAEDCPSRRTWRQADEGAYLPLVAARYQDPLAQWMSRQIPRTHPQLLWPDLLWDEPSVLPMEPTGLPLARLFEGIGWVAMRSGWSNRQDTFALFQCGPFYSARQHLDNNSFVIHKIRPLAVDSGVDEPTSHRANYASRTVAHNTVVVIDDAEIFSDSVYGGEGGRGSNDGGQLRLLPPRRASDLRLDTKYQTGQIIAYEHRDPYTYVAADATRSYSAAKVDAFLRQFVYIRPNLFVIYDRVVASRPDFEKRWLLHMLVQPEVDGTLVTVWDRATYKLYSRTFLPEAPAIQVIGGGGQEFQVDGKNYPPLKGQDPEAGAWRVEVVPPEREAVTEFLHVLYACEHAREPMPVCQMIQEGRRVGVRGQAGGIAYTVWFDRAGAAGGQVQLTRGSDPILAREFPHTVIQEPADLMLQRWMVEREAKEARP